MLPLADKGFTLLEFLLAMVLTAILAIMVGTGVVSGFNLFAAARDNTHITQKANLALTRLTRELREITNVIKVDADQPFLIYQKVDLSTCYAIALDDDTIKLFSDTCDNLKNLMDATYIGNPNNGDILIDNVIPPSSTESAFSLSYRNGASAWQISDPIRELSAIEFEFTIGRNTLGGRSSTFGNTVHLRNNNNYGGAALTSTPPTPPTQSNYPCFIGAAKDCERDRPWCLSLPTILLPLLLLGLCRRQTKAAGIRALPLLNTRGAALIIVIVVLVVFSALAIIMLPMITTSQYTQLGQDSASKAYYLAESGYRYAASQYLKAGSDRAKNAALENLHNQGTFTLNGSKGSFELQVYPYYGYVQSDPRDSTTLIIHFPGGLPADLDADAFSGGGRLNIGRTTFSYSSAIISSTEPEISFTMDATMPSVSVGTDVYFVGQTKADSQSVSMNGTGTLEMAAGSTNTFPLRNGEVVIDDNVYAYRENIRSDTVNAQLVGITDPEDPSAAALNLDPSTDVVLSKFVDLLSTGSYGSGSIKGERLLTYHAPLPTSKYSQHRLEFHDTFENLDHWTTIWGSQSVYEIDNDNAVRIMSTEWDAVFPKISLAALDWTTTDIDLEWIHQRADHFLSYDAQVKIGFLHITPEPPWGYTPPTGDIPTYFTAGLSFRLDSRGEDHNAYGLSFMRGNRNLPSPFDNIPQEIVPLDDLPLIVLWQVTNNGATTNWLAYKQIGGLVIFEEDAESGVNGWTADGLWNINAHRANGGSNAWYYGQDGIWNYNTGGITSGDLISPEIDLDICEYDERLALSFWSWHSTETQDPENNDLKTVDIRTYEGSDWSSWTELEQIEGSSSSGWEYHELDLRSYLGERVQLRFHFDSVTASDNNFEGWYVDDIEISGNWPRVDSTLAVRLKEAPSLQFTLGGPYEIQLGDLISQNDASAVVDGVPVVTSGSWAGGDAAGDLILKDLVGSFTASQPFNVFGVGEAGTVQGVRSRDNYIRVYFSSASGCGEPNSDPLDNQRLASPRNPSELNWPPQDDEPYTSEVDAFTLIAWDAVNSSVTSLSQLAPTLLRSNEGVLLTSDEPLGRFSRPEFGLHALGHGAPAVYFDDFGLTVTYNGPLDVTSPIQE